MPIRNVLIYSNKGSDSFDLVLMIYLVVAFLFIHKSLVNLFSRSPSLRDRPIFGTEKNNMESAKPRARSRKIVATSPRNIPPREVYWKAIASLP